MSLAVLEAAADYRAAQYAHTSAESRRDNDAHQTASTRYASMSDMGFSAKYHNPTLHNYGMPVQFGIVCGRRSNLTSLAVKGAPAAFVMTASVKNSSSCICANTTYFRSHRLVPFIVAEEDVQRGYAEIDDCRLLTKKSGKVNE